MCDQVFESYNEETKTIPKTFNERKTTCKMQIFFILLAFLLITLIFFYKHTSETTLR